MEQEVEVGAIPMEIWHGDLVPRDHSSFEFQVTNSNLAKDQGCSNSLSGSLWLRQPVEDLRFDLGISFYGFTRCSWTIPNLRKSPFVIWAPVARCAAVAVR